MTSTRDNSKQSLTGAQKAKPSFIRNPEQAVTYRSGESKAITYKEPRASSHLQGDLAN